MKPAPWKHIEAWRIAGERYAAEGAFIIPHHPTNVRLMIVASSGGGWDHVSVSLQNRTPNWREMDYICRMFWSDDECVMQLHPPRSQWISNHRYCLHMWKPQDVAILQPPDWMVGSKAHGEIDHGTAAGRVLAEALYAAATVSA